MRTFSLEIALATAMTLAGTAAFAQQAPAASLPSAGEVCHSAKDHSGHTHTTCRPKTQPAAAQQPPVAQPPRGGEVCHSAKDHSGHTHTTCAPKTGLQCHFAKNHSGKTGKYCS
jgi:hypothetical protein